MKKFFTFLAAALLSAGLFAESTVTFTKSEISGASGTSFTKDGVICTLGESIPTVSLSFDNGLITTSAEEKKILVTAVDTETHKYSVALGIQSENIIGEYTEVNLIPESSVIMKENAELVHFRTAQIKIVAGNGDGNYRVDAELLGDDGVTYKVVINVPYVQEIVTKSFDNGLITTSAEDEAILVSAVDTDNHKYSVALGINSKEIVGEFTEKDLVYASSVIMKENGELVHILGAHITIVAGNGNGDYQVEAELLGYDFVLYDLSIYVKAVQQIVTKSFDNGLITTSAEDQVFVSAIDSVNHKLSIVLGINSKDIVGEFTEKDLIAEVSVIMKENAEFVHILGAHITIVAGNGDGDYQVEAEILGDDFVLYDLSIYVPAQSEGVENVQGNKVQSTKVIRDGQLLIEKNGRLYNALGAELK